MDSWRATAKVWLHTSMKKAVPGHNILVVTIFFLISRLCSPMAGLHLILIIPTLSSSNTFLSFLCLTPEVQQICHSSCFVGKVKCFQLLVITLFTVFLSACVQLSWTQSSQNYIQRRFHKCKDINGFLCLLEKKIHGDCLLQSQITLTDHNHPLSNGALSYYSVSFVSK